MDKLSAARAIRNLHVWLGLFAGAAFCIMSLSGSLLVFRSEIDKALRFRRAPSTAPRSADVLSRAVHNVMERWPRAREISISMPEAVGQPFEFEFVAARRQRVLVDSQSGTVWGIHSVPWLAWIVELHANLQTGFTQVAGAIGVLLFLTSLTGITLWLVRSRSLPRVSWSRSWKQVSFELHRATGLLGYAMLLIVSLTGIYLGLSPAAAEPVIEMHAEALPLEKLMGVALEQIPGAQVRQIELGERVAFHIWTDQDPRPEGSNRVTVDAASGRVLLVERVADWNATARLMNWIRPVHFAEWGGLGLKTCWSLIGLIPPVLFASGLLVWLRPYFRPAVQQRRD